MELSALARSHDTFFMMLNNFNPAFLPVQFMNMLSMSSQSSLSPDAEPSSSLPAPLASLVASTAETSSVSGLFSLTVLGTKDLMGLVLIRHSFCWNRVSGDSLRYLYCLLSSHTLYYIIHTEARVSLQ